MDFVLQIIGAILSAVFEFFVLGIRDAWRWVLSPSYRLQVSQSLAQAGKFKTASVYLGGTLSFLLSLLIVAGLAWWGWWQFTMPPASHGITNAVNG